MATQIVMDHSGDSRHFFDNAHPEEILRAETLFNDLIAKGYTAAARTGAGEATRLGKFDPTAEETLFFPRLVGG